MYTDHEFTIDEDPEPTKVYSINPEELGTDNLQHFLDTLFDTNQEDSDNA